MTTNQAPAPDKKPFEIPQRWLTIFAGVVLVAILGAVLLSVGIWIKDGSPAVAASFGFRGAPNRGFQPPPGGNIGGQGPQGQQQRGGGPPPNGNNNGPPNQNQVRPNNNGALTRQPDFVGSVQGVSSSTLTITTPAGQRTFRIIETTVIYRASGSKGTIDDLTQGSSVAVVTANAPGALTALEIQLQR